MWDLPRPGLESVFPALAGGFLTTVPPGKSRIIYFYICNSSKVLWHWVTSKLLGVSEDRGHCPSYSQSLVKMQLHLKYLVFLRLTSWSLWCLLLQSLARDDGVNEFLCAASSAPSSPKPCFDSGRAATASGATFKQFPSGTRFSFKKPFIAPNMNLL